MSDITKLTMEELYNLVHDFPRSLESDNGWPEIRHKLERLEKCEAALRWRPIEELHEDFGPCVVIHLNNPGNLELTSNLDPEYDESEWTHFVPVPKLTTEEAMRLRAARVALEG